MYKKRGKQSFVFSAPPVISSTAAIGGPMEGEGKLGAYLDEIMADNLQNQPSWEKCESYMMEWAIKEAVKKTIAVWKILNVSWLAIY